MAATKGVETRVFILEIRTKEKELIEGSTVNNGCRSRKDLKYPRERPGTN